jgi:hypothetical protein
MLGIGSRIVAKALIHVIQPELAEFFHCEILGRKVTTRMVDLASFPILRWGKNPNNHLKV